MNACVCVHLYVCASGHMYTYTRTRVLRLLLAWRAVRDLYLAQARARLRVCACGCARECVRTCVRVRVCVFPYTRTHARKQPHSRRLVGPQEDPPLGAHADDGLLVGGDPHALHGARVALAHSLGHALVVAVQPARVCVNVCVNACVRASDVHVHACVCAQERSRALASALATPHALDQPVGTRAHEALAVGGHREGVHRGFLRSVDDAYGLRWTRARVRASDVRAHAWARARGRVRACACLPAPRTCPSKASQ